MAKCLLLRHILRLELTSFFGAQIKEVENENGEKEECVCIPITRNNLRKGKTGKVSSYAFINPMYKANPYGWTYYVTMKASRDFVNEKAKLGYRMPILGNMRQSFPNDQYDIEEDKNNYVKIKDL